MTSSSVRCGVRLLAILPWIVGALLPARADANPGDLDPTFGVGGKVTTTVVTSKDLANGLALQSDGKIVAVGQTDNAPGNFVLARYTHGGLLDTTFDGDGKLSTDFGASRDDSAWSVVVQPDGKIVVVGQSGAPSDFALARYLPSGALDATFGAGGKVRTDFATGSDDLAFGVALQSDGKIVVVGATSPTLGGDYSFAVARYTAAGVLDTTFGSGGTTTSSIGMSAGAFGVALQSDGRIIAAGFTDEGAGLQDIAVARYETDGSPDATFGSFGTVVTDFSPGQDEASSVVVQLNGRIVVAGSTTGGITDFALVRYQTNGTLDPTFGSGGKVTHTFSDLGATYATANGLALRSDGKLVAGGATDDGIANASFFALALYDPSGAPDLGFGFGGLVVTSVGVGNDIAWGVAGDDDGSIVLAGQSSSADFTTSKFALARYQAPLGCPLDSCGDGQLEPACGEECDDGNTQNGDCCSSSCQYEAPGAACAGDAEPCTVDACNGAGTCTHVDAPDPSCIVPQSRGASLKINTQIQFKWRDGPPISSGDFGAPDQGSPAFALCVYDEKNSGATTTRIVHSQAGSGNCGTKACWSQKSTGWKFQSKDGAPQGAVSVQLVEGLVPGKARLQFKGKGSSLILPPLPLAKSPSVIAQLRTTNGKCWGAVFSSSRVNGTQFSATSD